MPPKSLGPIHPGLDGRCTWCSGLATRNWFYRVLRAGPVSPTLSASANFCGVAVAILNTLCLASDRRRLGVDFGGVRGTAFGPHVHIGEYTRERLADRLPVRLCLPRGDLTRHNALNNLHGTPHATSFCLSSAVWPWGAGAIGHANAIPASGAVPVGEGYAGTWPNGYAVHKTHYYVVIAPRGAQANR